MDVFFKKNKTIIFCQANADLLYTIDLIGKHKNVIVYVINVKGIYEFLVSLKIKNIKTKFIPYFKFSFFNPKSIYDTRNSLNDLWKNEFSKYKNCDVFFFSTSYDWLTASCVKRLSLQNKVTYYNHYDHLTSSIGYNSFSLKRELKKLIFLFITETDFITNSKVNFPKFNYSKYKIILHNILKKPDINKDYLYKVKGGDINKALLLIDPGEIKNLENSSKLFLISIIKNLKIKKISVFLKGHPRLGEPKIFKSIVNYIIPNNIPSEFINYNCFDFVFGLTSASLCYPAQKQLCNVYSLNNIVSYKDPFLQKKLKDYINEYSGNKIIFDTKKLNAVLQ